MNIFEIEDSEIGAIKAVKFTGGKIVDKVWDLEAYLREVGKVDFYGVGVRRIVATLDSLAIKYRTLSTLASGEVVSIMIGKAKLKDMGRWNLEIRVDRDEDMLDAFADDSGKISGSPTLLVINQFKKATRGQAYGYAQESKITLMEAMLSSSKIPTKGFRPAYRGGLIACSADPYRVYDNVISYDIASSYPWSAATSLVPKGRTRSVSKEKLASLTIDKGTINLGENVGFIGLFNFRGLTRRDWVSIPMLRKKDEEYCVSAEFDRAGLTYADSARLALSTYDLRTLWLQYTWDDFQIEYLEAHRLGRLPKQITDFLGSAYLDKESKTGTERLKAKIAINSIIGCWGMDPFKSGLKQELVNGTMRLTYSKDLEPHWAKYSGVDGNDGITTNGRRTWDYRWAVYTCAAARMRIAEAEYYLQKNGLEILYCDTDSIKLAGDKVTADRVFAKLNERAAKLNSEVGLPEDMGKWVDESAAYAKAYFRGPKFYATEDYDGKRRAIVSGLYRDLSEKMVENITLEELADMDEIVITSSRPDYAEVVDDPFGADYQEVPRVMEFVYDREDSTIAAL